MPGPPCCLGTDSPFYETGKPAHTARFSSFPWSRRFRVSRRDFASASARFPDDIFVELRRRPRWRAPWHPERIMGRDHIAPSEPNPRSGLAKRTRNRPNELGGGERTRNRRNELEFGARTNSKPAPNELEPAPERTRSRAKTNSKSARTNSNAAQTNSKSARTNSNTRPNELESARDNSNTAPKRTRNRRNELKHRAQTNSKRRRTNSGIVECRSLQGA